MDMKKEEILHILVIGFHHKKGCQLEFSHPPLESLPEQWKTLPSLALPDGAHNFDSDVVYFHLNSLNTPLQTVFGVSCFQQIPLDKVKNKTADMTRGAVQKAVCIISTVPLYGYIQVKMELITAAFFDAGDFSQTTLLVDAFNHLNDCLPGSIGQHLCEGLSVKDFLLRFRHRALLLFKLCVLERKIVFFHSPVKPLCNTVLSLLSLHPGLVEFGLYESSFVSSSNPGSPTLPVPILEALPKSSFGAATNGNTHSKTVISHSEVVLKDQDSTKQLQDDVSTQVPSEIPIALDAMLIDENYFADDSDQSRNGAANNDKAENFPTGCDVGLVRNINFKSCGLPLKIFGKGNLCFPYLSISYLDFLGSAGVRGFVAGATNVLFKQKRDLSDVVVEIETGKVETACPDLRKQLSLTTEDLRFMEQMLRGIMEPNDVIIPGVGREGDEEWIRAHFHIYLVSLLRTSLLAEGSKELEHFNQHFVASWKNTHNYKMWVGLDHDGIFDVNPGHPGAGSLSVQDVRLRLSQAMMSSESGRKLNQAVATTGRAVGGALNQAKGVISGWWSNMTAQDGKPVNKSIENI